MSDTVEERLSALEKQFSNFKTDGDSKIKKEKKEKVPRKPSSYNKFMADEIKRIKKEKGDNYNHKETFTEVAKEWQKKKNKDDKK